MTNDTLTLADIDRVLPAEYDILQPDYPRDDSRHALRVVRHEERAQTYYFYSAREYFAFATSVIPRNRLLAKESGTCYIQLSASYDADPYFHASVTHTVAALTRSSVTLHRMKSDETSVRFVLTHEEMAALVEFYQDYLVDCERGSVAVWRRGATLTCFLRCLMRVLSTHKETFAHDEHTRYEESHVPASNSATSRTGSILPDLPATPGGERTARHTGLYSRLPHGCCSVPLC
jgi:hypothetical protein